MDPVWGLRVGCGDPVWGLSVETLCGNSVWVVGTLCGDSVWVVGTQGHVFIVLPQLGCGKPPSSKTEVSEN